MLPCVQWTLQACREMPLGVPAHWGAAGRSQFQQDQLEMDDKKMEEDDRALQDAFHNLKTRFTTSRRVPLLYLFPVEIH